MRQIPQPPAPYQFFVAVEHGKGVTLYKQYQGRVNGKLITYFCKIYFQRTYRRKGNPCGKLFLQDGDWSQQDWIIIIIIYLFKVDKL